MQKRMKHMTYLQLFISSHNNCHNVVSGSKWSAAINRNRLDTLLGSIGSTLSRSEALRLQMMDEIPA